MFRAQTTLTGDVLAGALRISVPGFDKARISSGELTDIAPTEYRADAVVMLTDADTTVMAVVVEVQLNIDARKRRAWPAYVATLHARLGCPVLLLVVCPRRAVAAWCAAPIEVGSPGLVLTPNVLGPDQIPVVTDRQAARRTPELTVLSAIAHGGHPNHHLVLDALMAALDVVDHEHANLYADVVLAGLPAASRDYLEETMKTTFRYQSDFARRYFDEGRTEGEAAGEARGEARAVLSVLDARGIEMPAHIRERIAGCTDLEQLDGWLHSAITARTVDELFA